MKLAFTCLLLGLSVALAQQTNPPPHNPPYPERWWDPVPRAGAPSWEILPQEAKYGEVILSKRNELGLLSNFAATSFVYKGRTIASDEGFWQATKYPENDNDPRAHISGVVWPHTRAEVENMVAFEAKNAGNEASDILKKAGIDWVSFQGKRMTYREPGESEFFKLIVEVMEAKLDQNDNVRTVLHRTGNLILRPDHHDADADTLKAWQYYNIWMDLRSRN